MVLLEGGDELIDGAANVKKIIGMKEEGGRINYDD